MYLRTRSLGGNLPRNQRIAISPTVVARLDKYRQRFLCSKEAGGQLFGAVTTNTVYVDVATGPTRKDDRSRFSFRSDPKLAQKEISRQHELGNEYLGEWHTHAEPFPEYSNADLQSVSAIFDRSELSVSAILLLIRGTAPLPQGLAAYCYLGRGLIPVAVSVIE